MFRWKLLTSITRERDVFVVETAGFNDKTTFDAMGHPHSEALRIIERFRRRDFGHLDVEMTFDDAKTYTKPFTIKLPRVGPALFEAIDLSDVRMNPWTKRLQG